MRKNINDLTFEEVKELLNNNNELDIKVYERAEDDAWYWIEEYLCGCKEHYELSAYGYSYFEINDSYDFENWFNKVQKMYCFVGDEEEQTVRKYFEKRDLLDYVENATNAKDKDIRNIEKMVDDLKEETEEIILKRFKAEYEAFFEVETRADYFMTIMEFFFDTDLENVFVDEKYNVFEVTPEEYVPAQYIPAHVIPEQIEKLY